MYTRDVRINERRNTGSELIYSHLWSLYSSRLQIFRDMVVNTAWIVIPETTQFPRSRPQINAIFHMTEFA